MSAAKTAALLNNLLASLKTDRARIKQLDGRLAEADTRQTTAVATAITDTEMQFKAQLDRVQQERTAEHASLTELAATKDRQITELATTKDWQITELKLELSGARQLLAAADASNVELHGSTASSRHSVTTSTRRRRRLPTSRTSARRSPSSTRP